MVSELLPDSDLLKKAEQLVESVYSEEGNEMKLALIQTILIAMLLEK